mmetsp:Transcript_30065/g.80236  ORF Transcript_30065/g.80236 Transcript_30065/m.80236 type:complete len:192 (-) Transcript_30065:46-621(-)|eukprot:CAMPEP_0194509964 /NCGR_PEP_ID=MMETSP0253-20130528/41250_1 /TAXON_ID=2966 /ORGANISM="Noctiluca scintillans" /LENGTH=191 /DNA_ID=CAMNT_0039353175 /DNA_START=15 /DNA_END=590 /DNA_ORIENTATION=-
MMCAGDARGKFPNAPTANDLGECDQVIQQLNKEWRANRDLFRRRASSKSSMASASTASGAAPDRRCASSSEASIGGKEELAAKDVIRKASPAHEWTLPSGDTRGVIPEFSRPSSSRVVTVQNLRRPGSSVSSTSSGRPGSRCRLAQQIDILADDGTQEVPITACAGGVSPHRRPPRQGGDPHFISFASLDL